MINFTKAITSKTTKTFKNPLPTSSRFNIFKYLSLLAMVLMLGVNGVRGQTTYNLITSTSGLVAGSKYLIVSTQTNGAGLALGYQITNNRPQASITVSSSSISVTPATLNSQTTLPFEITLGGTTGAWTLYDAVNAAYLKANSSSSNNLVSNTTADWTITFSSNAAVMTCTTGSFTRNILRYNSGSSLFSCYSSGQAAVYLYRAASITAPAAPNMGIITPSNQQLSVAFTAGSNGGSAITSYKYSTDGGATFLTRQTGTTASPIVITTLSSDGTTALTNGTSYDIQIKAVNAIGDGTATASTAATPYTTPSAPTINSITGGNTQLSVAFTAGATGGSAITNYQYSTDGGATFLNRQTGTTGSPIVITTLSSNGSTALTNGTPYNVQLKAVNIAGAGTATATTQGTPVAPVSPTISASASVGGAVSTTYGTASSATTFSASGVSLTNDIIITPPSGFEVSTTVGSGYTTSLTLTQSGGIVNSTTIYVRLMATAGVSGTYNNQNIVLSSTGATPVNVTSAASGNTVTAKALTITGLTGDDRVYDATTTATVSGTAAYSGLVNGESFSVTGTPIFVFASKAIGLRAITASGYTAPNNNYTLSSQPSVSSATITAATITITSPTATNRAYNATTNVTVGGSLSGVLLSDVVTLSTTGTILSAAVSTGKTVTFSISGADAGNYTLTQPGTTVDISKADQTITFGALSNVTTATANYSPGATATSGLTVTYTSSNTSVATIVTNQIDPQGAGTTNITASQAGDVNYNAASDVMQALTVTLAPVTLLAFEFAGAAGDETSIGSTSSASNIASSTISRGSSLTAGTNVDRFNATNWATGSITNAVSGNKYMEFTITPNSGYQFTVSSILFLIQRSNTGLSGIALRSSVDNYASNLDSEKSIVDNTSTQSFTFTFAQANSSSAITYRLYGYAEQTSGTGGLEGTGDDIVVTGTTSLSPTATISNTSFAQIGAQDIVRNTTNNPVSRFRVDVTNGATTLSTVSFTTPANASTNNYGGNDGTGVYTSDIDNFKLYYTTTSTFATSNLLGTSNSVNFRTTPGETVSFTSLALNLPIGTYYFWITTDVLSSATSDRKMTVNAPTLTLSVGTVSGSTTASGEQNIIGVPITYYLNGTNNISVATSYWTLPNGTGSQLGSLSTTDLYLNIGSSVSTPGDFTLSNGSKFIVNNGGNLTISSGNTVTGTIDVENGGTLTINSTSIPTLGTLGGTSTIIYGASGAQAVATKNYANLTISGGNTKTISGAAAVSGTLVINSSILGLGSNNISAANLTLDGSGTRNGTWGSTASSATYKNNTYFSGTGVATVTNNTALTPSISGVNASQSITYGAASITLTGTVSATGPVYPSNGETVSVTINGNTQTTTTTGGNGSFSINFTTSTIPASVTPYTITYAYAGSGFLNAASNETSTALTVNVATNNWTGGTGTWNTAGNWSLSRVPSSLNDNITISSGTPTLDVNYTLGAGRTLTLSGSAALIINPSSSITVAGSADFGGKLVTVQSDNTGTGSIGTITGTLSNATNVTVQRFVSGAGRYWRFLSSPVQSATIANWMTQFYVTGPCTIAPTSGLGSINDQGWHTSQANIDYPGPYNISTNNRAVRTTSIRQYVEANATSSSSSGLNAGWADVATNTTLTPGKGFRAFIRGPIGTTGQLNGTVPGQAAVTLSLSGTVNQGAVSPTLTNNSQGWNLVGNPYACAYDWNHVSTVKTNIANTIHVFDATSNGYKSYLPGSGGTLTDGIIPSGAAFFVQATGTPVLTFNEAAKITSSAPIAVHKGAKTNNFTIKYSKDSTENDEFMVVLIDNATLNKDGYDIIKLGNENLNLSSYGEDTMQLTLSAIPQVVSETRIKLNVEATAIATYTFDFKNMDNFQSNITVSLFDRYTNKTTDVRKNTKYTFDMGAGVNQWGKNRFELILNLDKTNVDEFALLNQTHMLVYPNPATDVLNINISNANFKNSEVVVYNISGTEVLKTNMATTNAQLNIETLSNGVYFVKVSNQNGFNKTVKFVK